jgi:hypothetical protein
MPRDVYSAGKKIHATIPFVITVIAKKHTFSRLRQQLVSIIGYQMRKAGATKDLEKSIIRSLCNSFSYGDTC